MGKQLKELIKDYFEIDEEFNFEITGLALDSRQIKSGDLFFAVIGSQMDGRKFIEMAVENGARAILVEADPGIETSFTVKQHRNREIPYIYIKNLRQHVGEIAANFFDHPSKDLTVIGVTGTNGKTTCCHGIAQALTESGYKVGVLGTVGNGIWGEHKQSQLTTPCSIELQALLKSFLDAGASHVVMEASSHGLDQGRMKGIAFDIAIFTNLTRDHLDYHGNMWDYGEAKRKLFQCPTLKYAVINVDDEFGRQLVEELHPRVATFGYSALGRSTEHNLPLIRAHQVHLSIDGLTASIHTPWGNGLLHTHLIGRFNLSNLLAIITVLGILKFSVEDIINLTSRIRGVPGRMQLFGGEGKPHVIVDYAHTPDALRQVLMALREYAEGELWCVFGCGGNRDQGKRAQMGQISESFADHVVVTDDNPRHEQPYTIVADILQGMARPEYAVIEHDRRRAIAHAISCANPQDIVLIAGKGHESYQQYGDEKRLFNDEVEVQMALTEYPV